MAKKKTFNHLSWTNKQRRSIKLKIRTYSIVHSALSILNILLQVVILAIAIVVLYILIVNKEPLKDFQITMTSLSAAFILIIFIFNIINIIYKEKMNWHKYKKIMDFIQVEYMKMEFKIDGYKMKKGSEEMFLNNVEKFAKTTLKNKKKHIKLKKVVKNALLGDGNA